MPRAATVVLRLLQPRRRPPAIVQHGTAPRVNLLRQWAAVWVVLVVVAVEPRQQPRHDLRFLHGHVVVLRLVLARAHVEEALVFPVSTG